MSLIKQAKAIVDLHPAHAAVVWEMAASDHTEEQILAAVEGLTVAAKIAADAAALVELTAKLVDAEAIATAATARADAAEAALIVAKAEADALKAHAKGGEAGALIKADADAAIAKKITRAEYDANPSAYAADIKARRVTLTD